MLLAIVKLSAILYFKVTIILNLPYCFKVSVTENDILSMLPETQAFYRPIRPNPMYDREEGEYAIFLCMSLILYYV